MLSITFDPLWAFVEHLGQALTSKLQSPLVRRYEAVVTSAMAP